jgi:hypothetical protein
MARRRRFGRKIRRVKRRRGGRRHRRRRLGRRRALGNTAGITPQNMFPYGVASSLLP